LLIGDAAHAMSPIGGVGINLAIQDAVAAANALAPVLSRGVTPSVLDLARVQLRRALPTRLVQALQVQLQNRVIAPALAAPRDAAPPDMPVLLRGLLELRAIRRIPALVFGVGFQREHVRALPKRPRFTASEVSASVQHAQPHHA